MLNRRGQNVVEYSILIALVIGVAIAMQTYIKRGLQGRVYDAVKHVGGALGTGDTVIVDETGDVNGTYNLTLSGAQYEPYYQESKAVIKTTQNEQNVTIRTNGNITRGNITESTIREKDKSYEKQIAPSRRDE